MTDSFEIPGKLVSSFRFAGDPVDVLVTLVVFERIEICIVSSAVIAT